MIKTNSGKYFEDFKIGATLRHPLPKTVTEGDHALYLALTGEHAPLYCSAEFARSLGYHREVVCEMLVFNIIFGKSVIDISLNASANLGYADVRFLRPVYPGDTLKAESVVIGKIESATGKSGRIYVHTKGFNQHNQTVVQFYRWLTVPKCEPEAETETSNESPILPDEVNLELIELPPTLRRAGLNKEESGGEWFLEDYEEGERIYHINGRTMEETDHMLATSAYQNFTKAHFNQHQMAKSRFGKRIIYGGHVISVVRALSFNGLENALGILGWNQGKHVSPTFSGDTLYAWSDILEVKDLPKSKKFGALRIRLVGVKNLDPVTSDMDLKFIDTDKDEPEEQYHPNVVLDLDYYLLMPKKEES